MDLLEKIQNRETNQNILTKLSTQFLMNHTLTVYIRVCFKHYVTYLISVDVKQHG